MNKSSEKDEVPRNSKKSSNTNFSKENHSEIERRRRLTMNSYISELSELFQQGVSKHKKLNKLAVLKCAVSYITQLQGESHKKTDQAENSWAFLSEEESRYLTLDALCGFEIVINCNNAQIMYASDAIDCILGCKPTKVIGSSIFELVHPEDHPKMDEQIKLHTNPTCQVFDFKKGIFTHEITKDDPFLRRRSFTIRMKCIDDPDLPKAYFCFDSKFSYRYENFKFCRAQRTTYSSGPYILMECSGVFESEKNGPCRLRMIAYVLEDSKLDETHDTSDQSCIQLSLDGIVTFIEKNNDILIGYSDDEIIKNYLVSFILGEDQTLFYETMNLLKNEKRKSSFILRLRILNKNGTFTTTRARVKCIRTAHSTAPEMFNILLVSENISKMCNQFPRPCKDLVCPLPPLNTGSPRYPNSPAAVFNGGQSINHRCSPSLCLNPTISGVRYPPEVSSVDMSVAQGNSHHFATHPMNNFSIPMELAPQVQHMMPNIQVESEMDNPNSAPNPQMLCSPSDYDLVYNSPLFPFYRKHHLESLPSMANLNYVQNLLVPGMNNASRSISFASAPSQMQFINNQFLRQNLSEPPQYNLNMKN